MTPALTYTVIQTGLQLIIFVAGILFHRHVVAGPATPVSKPAPATPPPPPPPSVPVQHPLLEAMSALMQTAVDLAHNQAALAMLPPQFQQILAAAGQVPLPPQVVTIPTPPLTPKP